MIAIFNSHFHKPIDESSYSIYYDVHSFVPATKKALMRVICRTSIVAAWSSSNNFAVSSIYHTGSRCSPTMSYLLAVVS